jgi:hypothetical protein
MAGLDPAIQFFCSTISNPVLAAARTLDGRLKGGHDDVG